MVLGGIAALGISGSAAARTTEGVSGEAGSAIGLDEQTAAEWTKQAVWESSGCSTELPLQVMYPGDTLLTINTLTELGAEDRVDHEMAAINAARLQVPGSGKYTVAAGGFDAFAGDVLGPWVRSTYGGIVLADRQGVSINRITATEFIRKMQLSSGGFGPRFAFLGDRPIGATTESTVYALKTLKYLDTLTPKTRGKTLSYLMDLRASTGGWPHSAGRTEQNISATYYALQALDTIDRLPPGIGKGAASFLRSREADGGGFYEWQGSPGIPPNEPDDTPNSNSDTTSNRRKVVTTVSTARAILSLAQTNQLDTLGSDDLDRHARWLANRQVTDTTDPRFNGGFETRGDRDNPVIDYRTNTRLALRALQTLRDHSVTHHADMDAGISFLVRCQHVHTGGIAAWPSYVTDNRSTAAAMRTLADLGATMPTALADTFARRQRSNGSIPPLGWDGRSQTDQTAHALLALSETGQLDAVDVGAAAQFIAAQQSDGGFAKYTSPDRDYPPSLSMTNVAVLGLAAAGELDRITKRAAGEYYAGIQRDSGVISTSSSVFDHVGDTSRALRALENLGELHMIDLDAATTYLADLPAENGKYWPNPPQAGWAVLGLAAADALDQIDTAATRTYLQNNQYGTGGYAARVFYLGYTSLERHAAAVAGLSLIGGHPDNGNFVGIQERQTLNTMDSEIAGVTRRTPGRGWLNSRDRLVAIEDLPERS